MQEVNLSLKIEEINLLLTALGNLPFIQVHELINKIQSQATSQLTPEENAQAKNTVIGSENLLTPLP